MTAIIPVGFGQVSYIFTQTGASKKASVSIGFALDDDSDLAGMANALGAAWTDTLGDITADTVFLETIAVVTDTIFAEIPYGLHGASTSFDCDIYEGLVIKKTSDRRGRSNRGRNYWPGLLSAGNIGPGGLLASGTVTALQTVADAFLAAFLAVPHVLTMNILHQEAGHGDPAEVSSLVVSNRVGLQRRRRDNS